MKKLHTLILAISTTIALHSQSVINFTACSTCPITNTAADIFTDQNSNIYIPTNSNQEFLKSTDGGVTFTNALFSGNCGNGAMVALGNKIISSTMMSTDGGATWTSHSLLGATDKFVKQSETNAIAIAQGGGSYKKTVDGGNTWSNSFFMPTPPASSSYVNNVIVLNNGDIIFSFYIPFSMVYMISKDNLATYSYSLTTPSSGSLNQFHSGYVDSNSKYVLYREDGKIYGYNQNQNLSAPTFTNTSTLTGATNTVSSYNYGVLMSSGSFVVIDNNATSNRVLRTAGTSTVSGINELSQLTVSLYPNPCVNTISINGLTKQYTYTVVNQLGQNVLQGSTNEQINTTTLMPGIYFLNIANQKVVKFIKE